MLAQYSNQSSLTQHSEGRQHRTRAWRVRRAAWYAAEWLEDRRLLSVADLAGPALMAAPLMGGGGASVAALASTVTLGAPADAHVRDGTYAGQNFGQAVTMEVKNVASAGYDRQAYVRFDLTGVGTAAEVTSAKVRLYGKLLNTMVASMPVGIYPVANTRLVGSRPHLEQPARGRRTALATKTVSGTTAGVVRVRRHELPQAAEERRRGRGRVQVVRDDRQPGLCGVQQRRGDVESAATGRQPDPDLGPTGNPGLERPTDDPGRVVGAGHGEAGGAACFQLDRLGHQRAADGSRHRRWPGHAHLHPVELERAADGDVLGRRGRRQRKRRGGVRAGRH